MNLTIVEPKKEAPSHQESTSFSSTRLIARYARSMTDKILLDEAAIYLLWGFYARAFPVFNII